MSEQVTATGSELGGGRREERGGAQVAGTLYLLLGRHDNFKVVGR